jgi:hypothetical protein
MMVNYHQTESVHQANGHCSLLRCKLCSIPQFSRMTKSSRAGKQEVLPTSCCHFPQKAKGRANLQEMALLESPQVLKVTAGCFTPSWDMGASSSLGRNHHFIILKCLKGNKNWEVRVLCIHRRVFFQTEGRLCKTGRLKQLVRGPSMEPCDLQPRLQAHQHTLHPSCSEWTRLKCS